MSKLPNRGFYLVLPNTQRTVLIPRPKPVTVSGRSLMTAIREHNDDLHVLALENPAMLQGFLDATKLAAKPYRKRGVQPGRRR